MPNNPTRDDRRIILHLCADIGSDSRPYSLDDRYDVRLIGKDIGVENYSPPENVWGIIANPVCTEFQTINGYGKKNDTVKGMFLVNHCQRIIKQAMPKWWVMENPARGELRRFIGEPIAVYQPWQYGASWTKATALWGIFTMPEKKYARWEDVPDKLHLYARPGRGKPNLAFLHKSAIEKIPEMQWAKDKIKTDADLRSMCCAGFSQAFKEANP